MEVETGLVKYAVLSVRMGKMTPSEAKVFVKGKNQSNPPRHGKQIAVIGSEAEWERIFGEAEKLRDDDIADRHATRADRQATVRENEITRRILFVVGGIIILVLVLTAPAVISPFLPLAGGAFLGICLHPSSAASFSPCPTGFEKEYEILKKEYGRTL